jgi:hypothetical protein
VARIAGAGGGVKPPDLFPALRVVCIDEAAHAVLGAGDADDHFVLHHERCGRPAVAVPKVLHRGVPQQRACLAADRHNMRVERGLEESIAEHAEAPIHQTAADDEAARKIAPVAPDLPAGPRIDRPPGVERPGDVNDAVEDERRSLEFAERVGLERPLRGQAMHVLGRDLRERTVAVIAVVARVGQPARRILQPVAQILRCHLRGGLLLCGDRPCHQGRRDERGLDVRRAHVFLLEERCQVGA